MVLCQTTGTRGDPGASGSADRCPRRCKGSVGWQGERSRLDLEIGQCFLHPGSLLNIVQAQAGGQRWADMRVCALLAGTGLMKEITDGIVVAQSWHNDRGCGIGD